MKKFFRDQIRHHFQQRKSHSWNEYFWIIISFFQRFIKFWIFQLNNRNSMNFVIQSLCLKFNGIVKKRNCTAGFKRTEEISIFNTTMDLITKRKFYWVFAIFEIKSIFTFPPVARCEITFGKNKKKKKKKKQRERKTVKIEVRGSFKMKPSGLLHNFFQRSYYSFNYRQFFIAILIQLCPPLYLDCEISVEFHIFIDTDKEAESK